MSRAWLEAWHGSSKRTVPAHLTAKQNRGTNSASEGGLLRRRPAERLSRASKWEVYSHLSSPQGFFSKFGPAGHVERPDPEPGTDDPLDPLDRGHGLDLVQHLHHALIEAEIPNRPRHLPVLDREEAVPGHPREGHRHGIHDVRVPNARDQETALHPGDQVVHPPPAPLEHQASGHRTPRIRHRKPVPRRLDAVPGGGHAIVDWALGDPSLDDRDRARRDPFRVEGTP